MIDLSPIVAAALTAPIVAGLGFRLAHWLDARKAARLSRQRCEVIAQIVALPLHSPSRGPLNARLSALTRQQLAAECRRPHSPSAWRGAK